MIPLGFFGKPVVWKYLELPPLPEETRELLLRAFRTRIRMEGQKMDFQFRILPEDVTDMGEEAIENLRILLIQKLREKNPDKEMCVTIKIALCCGRECFGCERYSTELT